MFLSKSERLTCELIHFKKTKAIHQGFFKAFQGPDSGPIRVPRIENRVPRIGENFHRVPRIRENRVTTWVPGN